jgi:hypothetical protein
MVRHDLDRCEADMFSCTRLGRAVAAAGIATALVAGVAACGSSVPQDSVEEQIVTQLGAAGLQGATADCPGDLNAEVGESITCSVTAGETFDVSATVTSVQGDTANFDIERTDGAPLVPPPAAEPDAMTADSSGVVDGQDVAQAVFDQLTAIVGQEPDEVRCPDLPAEVGASIRCELDAEGETYGVTVDVTAVQPDGVVDFDIAVDDSPS